jgi:peptidoglycan hydrolase-like protein with peptidoglycan-binding domain
MRPAIRRPAGLLAVAALLAAVLPGPAGLADAATPWPAGRGPAAVVARPITPGPAVLRPGMRGGAVRALQRRLAQLHYYPGAANGHFGIDTLEAVWAFKEVQGLPTTAGPDDVSPDMQRALAAPRPPAVLVPGGGRLRIEVDLARETLVLYRHGQIDLISHVSAGGGYYYPCPGGGTCGPAITPDGNYRAHWFAGGWLRVPLGRMYNAVFFIGSSFAIHGDIPIPLRPASHGCVRVPVDVARFLYTRIRVSQPGGTPIYIRGHAPGTWPPRPRPRRPGQPPPEPVPQRGVSPAYLHVPGLLNLEAPG